MTLLFLAAVMAAAIFSVTALILLSTAGRSPTETRLMEVSSIVASGNAKYKAESLMAGLTRPLAPVKQWLKSMDEGLGYRLSLAGFRQPQHVENFISAKLFCPVLGVVLATFVGKNSFLFASILLGAAGFFAPDIYLILATTKRKAAMSKALPDFVDLLVICIDAGSGMDQSVLKIASEIKMISPQLAEELLFVGREQRAGKPRVDAWRSMADRTDLDIVRQFVGMLTQAEKFGTPIARSLSIFAESLRTKRLLEAEEFAAKTSIKLIFPLVLCIFPAMFIVLLGPALLSIMKVFRQ
jgi:tight adherence protein C